MMRRMNRIITEDMQCKTSWAIEYMDAYDTEMFNYQDLRLRHEIRNQLYLDTRPDSDYNENRNKLRNAL